MVSCLAANGITYELTPYGHIPIMDPPYLVPAGGGSGAYDSTWNVVGDSSFDSGHSSYPTLGEVFVDTNYGAGNPCWTRNEGGFNFLCGTNSHVIIRVIGPGTLTVHTSVNFGAGCASGTTIYGTAYRSHSGVTVASASAPLGTDMVFVIPDDGVCAHAVNIGNYGTAGQGPYGFGGAEWVPLGWQPPVLEPEVGIPTAYPVIRGTSLIGTGSLSTATSDDGDELDHDASQIHLIDSADLFAATTVEGALSELAAQDPVAGHLVDTSDAHDGSAISFVPGSGVAAIDVQGAVAELATDLQSHLVDTAAHAALDVPFTPTGSITATTVQDAIAQAAASMGGTEASGLLLVMTTSPNIVTTDGQPAWVPLVYPDGTPVMLEVS